MCKHSITRIRSPGSVIDCNPLSFIIVVVCHLNHREPVQLHYQLFFEKPLHSDSVTRYPVAANVWTLLISALSRQHSGQIQPIGTKVGMIPFVNSLHFCFTFLVLAFFVFDIRHTRCKQLFCIKSESDKETNPDFMVFLTIAGFLDKNNAKLIVWWVIPLGL
jgi:hypothetical protein